MDVNKDIGDTTMKIKRNIVIIDEDKCNGCGICVNSCAEGAIQIINGKAKLVSEVYCDGLGACLGTCPTDAITVEQREAEPFDEAATEEYLKSQPASQPIPPPIEKPHGCPGTMARQLTPQPCHDDSSESSPSQLGNWPVQLSLAGTSTPCFQNADLLLVADCVPFAFADFHKKFLKGNPVIIGCPKLDDAQFYADKFTELLQVSSVKSLTVIHMEVPCCSGLVRIAQIALENAGKEIPATNVTISIKGDIIGQSKL